MFEFKKKMLHFKLIKHTKFCLDEIAIIDFILVTSITHHNKSHGKKKIHQNHEIFEKTHSIKGKKFYSFQRKAFNTLNYA